MATFVYTAKKSTAETVSGKINARSQDEAIDLINQLGFLPVSVEPQSGSSPAPVDLSDIGKIKSKEIYLFTRQLSNLLKSGVSILQALNLIQAQSSNRDFQAVLAAVAGGIKNGRSLSDCLADFPQVFPGLYVTMVHAGEESGNLQELLVQLANYQRNQEEIISKVKTALAYPCLMGVVGLGTIYFILTFALPKISSPFDTMKQTLPLPTVILLAVSDFLTKFWYVTVILIAAAVISFIRWRKTPQGKTKLDILSLKVPFFGDMILKTELARFSRTLLLLLRSGIPVVRSLAIAIPILDNDVIKGCLLKCKDDLTAGGSFGASLKKAEGIPAMMGHLITIGEESGNLNEVLSEITETYEQETNEKIKVMTTLLEPVMILVVGAIVGFIVFAMLLPIFQVDVL